MTLSCPACNTEQTLGQCYLGRLGIVTHYRCRACGAGWFRKQTAEQFLGEMDEDIEDARS